jgi:hypothetical protein
LISAAKIYRAGKSEGGTPTSPVKWGELTTAVPEYYPASDISTAFVDKVKAAMKVA